MTKVLCIIVNYKQVAATFEAVESVLEQSHKDVHVCVVDNESETNKLPVELLADRRVTWIHSKTNLGFAGAVNLAAKKFAHRNFDYVWLLNNDAVAAPSALECLVYNANIEPSICGSLIVHRKDPAKVWCAGARLIRPWFIVQHIGKNFRISELNIRTRKVDFLNGCSLLIPYEKFLSLGGLDESMFLYGEDVDLCERAGLPLILAAESHVLHNVSLSTGGESNPIKEYYIARNGIHLIRRFVRNRLISIFAISSRIFYDMFRIVRAAIRTNRGLAYGVKLFYKAYKDAFTNRLGQIDPKYS